MPDSTYSNWVSGGDSSPTMNWGQGLSFPWLPILHLLVFLFRCLAGGALRDSPEVHIYRGSRRAAEGSGSKANRNHGSGGWGEPCNSSWVRKIGLWRMWQRMRMQPPVWSRRRIHRFVASCATCSIQTNGCCFFPWFQTINHAITKSGAVPSFESLSPFECNVWLLEPLSGGHPNFGRVSSSWILRGRKLLKIASFGSSHMLKLDEVRTQWAISKLIVYRCT